jgi:tetratricopeptide (TPR) repeat protein
MNALALPILVHSKNAQDDSRRGAARLAQGDFAAARADFDRALEAAPDYPEAYNNRGVSRHALGDLVGAMTDFNRALEIAPRYALAFCNRGAARHALGDLVGAVADLDRALELSPRHASASIYHNRGAARHCLGDLEGAVADFDQAVLLEPDSADSHAGRGAARYALGEYQGAVVDYDEALRLTPREAAAPVYHSRGGARHAAGDFAGAIADYNQALEIDSGLCVAYVSRGHARFHQRDRLAANDYRTAFRLDPRLAAAEIVRVVAADLKRDPASVLENCRKHLRIHAGDFVAHARRGLTLLLQGNDSAAEQDFQEWLRLAPEWKDQLRLLIDEAQRRRGS